MLKKTFIFSLMNASYQYCIHIIQANSFKEACEILNQKDIDILNIKDYNYNPETDIDKFNFCNQNRFRSEKLKQFIPDNILRNNIEECEVFNLSYETLVNDCHEYTKSISISGKEYLHTNKPFYDYIEVMSSLKENYYFTDGHDG